MARFWRVAARDAAEVCGWWMLALVLYLFIFGSLHQPVAVVILAVIAFCSLFPAHVIVRRLLLKTKAWWLYLLSVGMTAGSAVILFLVLAILLRLFGMDGLALLALLSSVATSFLPVLLFGVFGVNVLSEMQLAREMKTAFNTRLFWLNAVLAGLVAYILSLVVSFMGF